VADGSISRPTVDQAIKHFGSSSAPHNGVSNGNGHANGQANGKANGKADSSSDEELGKESPRPANGAASAGKKPAKETISAAAKELVKRGFEGYGTQGDTCLPACLPALLAAPELPGSVVTQAQQSKLTGPISACSCCAGVPRVRRCSLKLLPVHNACGCRHRAKARDQVF
jgi:hypothetical protein